MSITKLAIASQNIIDSAKEKYSNISTFEASIFQENHFIEQDIVLLSTGTFFLQNSTVVIEYLEPFYQFIKANNEGLTIYSKDQNAAIISSQNEQPILHPTCVDIHKEFP